MRVRVNGSNGSAHSLLVDTLVVAEDRVWRRSVDALHVQCSGIAGTSEPWNTIEHSREDAAMPTLFPEPRNPRFFDEHPWAFVISDALRFSPGADFDQAREFIDRWLDEYPGGDDKIDLANRLLGDNAQFIPAFYELAVFAALRRVGFDVQPHPTIPGTPRHPDFLASREGNRIYVEVGTAGAHRDVVAAERRQDDLFGQIQRARVPGYSLVFERHVTGTRAPSRRNLLTWINERLAGRSVQGDEHDLGTWEYEDWRIGVSAIPDLDDPAGERPIGMVVDVGIESSTPRLVATIRDKQSAYGALDAPYLIVLGTNVIHAGERELRDALFGSIRWEMNLETRDVNVVRARDGCWFGPAGQRGEQVSAILFVPGLGPRSLSTTTWTLVHHPGPTHRLQIGVFPFAAEHVWVDGALSERLATESFEPET